MSLPLPLVMLPGMDGSGDLFYEFAAIAPSSVAPLVTTLPSIGPYDDLLRELAVNLPESGKFAILAESFSGPLAIRLAALFAPRVVSLVLCNTFATSPRHHALRMIPWRLMFSFPPPAGIIRGLLLDSAAPQKLVERVQAAVRNAHPKVMAARIRAVLAVNEIGALRKLSCPVLYLRGTNDRLIPQRNVDEFARNVAIFRQCNINGPHMLLQTQSVRVWEAIEPFLRETGAG